MMVCSSPLMAMAVTHSANRRKLGPVKGEGRQQGLPDRPKPLSVSHGTSPVAVPKGFDPPPVASAREMPRIKKIQRFRCSVLLFIYSGVF